jgi:hypothetical protein
LEIKRRKLGSDALFEQDEKEICQWTFELNPPGSPEGM